VPYVSESDFAGEVLGYADAVVVEAPAELRASVRDRLAGIAAGATP
jgi:proteasome accessory factor B